MDATGRDRQPLARGGVFEKPNQRLPFGGVLDPAHRHPQSREHRRGIGGAADFDYSPVLRKAREDGLRWDAKRLETFLADPAGMFPGLWMSMRGIEDPAERRALVRFLEDPASR